MKQIVPSIESFQVQQLRKAFRQGPGQLILVQIEEFQMRQLEQFFGKRPDNLILPQIQQSQRSKSSDFGWDGSGQSAIGPIDTGNDPWKAGRVGVATHSLPIAFVFESVSHRRFFSGGGVLTSGSSIGRRGSKQGKVQDRQCVSLQQLRVNVEFGGSTTTGAIGRRRTIVVVVG